jgi:hypothetical protein
VGGEGARKLSNGNRATFRVEFCWENLVMSEQLVTPDNLSKELLESAFDSAFMDTSFDDDGDLRVCDGGIRCYVLVRKDRIRLMSLFGSEEGASREDLLEFANRVNDEYVVIRASVTAKGTVCFDYDILVTGGVTTKAIVLATKRFLGIPVEAIQEHGKELIK